ncbi:SIMPL domain-containing protein [Aspergillus chevalieri]|uniref:SIMPL domain-containing protein n=1 Tax=Aspergillus chevalieri TaxID=182096 RepID=A0A7R7ZLD7_ASPCH|nr:uncharacterized protein ACHE_30330S [Aspergillus chevalieri]BCR86343.1 hypothetical protein ACHE_30330S [Aspergillus chevalieri]
MYRECVSHEKSDTMAVTINVTGTSTIYHHPEQAVLSVHIQSEGPSRNLVSSYVTTRSNLLHRHLRDLAPRNSSGQIPMEAPVSNIAIGSERSWSTIPRDRNGHPMDRVYHASTDVEITFRNFTKLGKVAKRLITEENVEISKIVWQLTKDTREVLGVESRKQAMKDAIRRAQDYAAVIGKEVEPMLITDRESKSTIGTAKCMAVNAKIGVGEEDSLDLAPPDIEFHCSVEVQFRSAASGKCD